MPNAHAGVLFCARGGREPPLVTGIAFMHRSCTVLLSSIRAHGCPFLCTLRGQLKQMS